MFPWFFFGGSLVLGVLLIGVSFFFLGAKREAWVFTATSHYITSNRLGLHGGFLQPREHWVIGVFFYTRFEKRARERTPFLSIGLFVEIFFFFGIKIYFLLQSCLPRSVLPCLMCDDPSKT